MEAMIEKQVAALNGLAEQQTARIEVLETANKNGIEEVNSLKAALAESVKTSSGAMQAQGLRLAEIIEALRRTVAAAPSPRDAGSAGGGGRGGVAPTVEGDADGNLLLTAPSGAVQVGCENEVSDLCAISDVAVLAAALQLLKLE